MRGTLSTLEKDGIGRLVLNARETPSLKTEAIAGVTTFVTMAYILFVNPSILSTPGTGLAFDSVLTATVLLSFSMTLLMGLYARLPFAVAPGMGINAFFAFSLILGQKVPASVALGMVFWAGVFFLLISFTPLREEIAKSIPHPLRIGAAAGIGIFLSFIGLKNMGLVVGDAVTLVRPGALGKTAVLSLIGLFLSAILLRKKSPFAFLSGILVVTLLALALGEIHFPAHFFALPNFKDGIGELDIMGALKFSYLPAIMAILFTDLFDSISTFVGVSHACGLKDERGEPKNLKQGLIVDAFATLFAGVLGTSSGTAYIESAAGIEMGGRTGRTSVFTALCFLPFLFFAPLAAIVPSYATGPVLVLVGALLFRSVAELHSDSLEEILPAYICLILIPLSFSITQGLLWGFIAHVTLFSFAGRRKEISKLLWGLAILSVVLLVMESRRHL